MCVIFPLYYIDCFLGEWKLLIFVTFHNLRELVLLRSTLKLQFAIPTSHTGVPVQDLAVLPLIQFTTGVPGNTVEDGQIASAPPPTGRPRQNPCLLPLAWPSASHQDHLDGLCLCVCGCVFILL